ncbi:ABC transporter ATP-binding protein [Nocardioidaceae bacterium SCSIO 66511]|nr:ABC transporter ATP-binding protein [Nocardioidaceae bacterium SCSIO 66511]
MTTEQVVETVPEERTSDTVAVDIRGVRKVYGDNAAVDGVDLTVAGGEFLTLLGPSGCGKTTLLSMLAGFIDADEGSISVYGEDMTRVPPHRRPVNTVFQDYALFPHLNVVDNVAFGLRMESVPKRKARERALEALAMVDLESHAQLRVGALSGGQKQRATLARALIKQPKVLLLDEPFAALDLRLRRRMQLELRSLHRQQDTTFVFVTHDQEEAATLSDRIAVLKDGRIEQTGTPEEIYDEPQTRFVAGFIGESNVLDATVDKDGRVDVDDVGVVPAPAANQSSVAGTRVAYALRPERIRLVKPHRDASDEGVEVGCVVEEVIRVGETVKVIVRTSCGVRLNASMSASAERVSIGDEVAATWHAEDGRVLAD